MLGQNWYFGLNRKYIALFGTLFSDINITREDASGLVTHVIKVPITHGPKEKVLARVKQDPDITKGTAINLPIMSFQCTHWEYDPERHLPTTNRVVRSTDDPNHMKYNYVPVAYDFHFELCVYVKFQEDGTKIIEQILPYFTPSYTATLHLIPEMDMDVDIPIVLLNGCDVEDTYDGNFINRQAIIYTFNFVLKGYLWGPIRTKPIIKFVKTNFYQETIDANNLVGTITVSPGLTANGEPTSNLEETVDRLTIDVTDDFGYITENSEDDDNV